jgi:hypothetical protein
VQQAWFSWRYLSLFATLALSHTDGGARKVDILNSQTQALYEPRAAAIKQPNKKPLYLCHGQDVGYAPFRDWTINFTLSR